MAMAPARRWSEERAEAEGVEGPEEVCLTRYPPMAASCGRPMPVRACSWRRRTEERFLAPCSLASRPTWSITLRAGRFSCGGR
jgi:hypothetical protein